MNLKILSAALLVASIIALTANADEPVPGWVLAGSHPDAYEIGTHTMAGTGSKAGYLRSTKSSIDGFGTLMQTFSATDLRGQRAKLSASIRTAEAGAGAGLWMRVDGSGAETLAFDNMHGRPIIGTQAWNTYEVVLDVPENASSISIGVLMRGTGTVWLDDVKIGAVPTSVPVTAELPSPVNLKFEDN